MFMAAYSQTTHPQSNERKKNFMSKILNIRLDDDVRILLYEMLTLISKVII